MKKVVCHLETKKTFSPKGKNLKPVDPKKQKMSNRAKAKTDATKRFDVTKLKGPRS